MRVKEHSSIGKRGGGGGGGFYLSALISQSIYPRKINLVLYVRGQKLYLESTLILAILSKKNSLNPKRKLKVTGFTGLEVLLWENLAVLMFFRTLIMPRTPRFMYFLGF